ncbi:MAG: PD-(D/E)XK nuclease family protein [Lentisphaeria bacterium]|nr:PD-(D/E)XK nuclease family protein [Lentisphaeria bacterium]
MERSIDTVRETPHWSYSAFNTYLTCPMRYYFRYIEHAEAERTSVSIPFGRAFHAVLSERAMKGADYTVEDAKEDFSVFFKGEAEVCEKLTYKQDEDYLFWEQRGCDMLDVALAEWTDDYTVKSVAEAFSVEVPGLSKPLIGEFDLVVTDGGDETICDWKTASMKWPAGKADRDLQATTFCYAYRQLHGRMPMFRFDVFTKAKAPAHHQFYTYRNQDDLDRFVYLAGQIEKVVNTGIFLPVESCMNCSECAYSERCKAAHRKAG